MAGAGTRWSDGSVVHLTYAAPKHDPMKLGALRNRTLHITIVRLQSVWVMRQYATCDMWYVGMWLLSKSHKTLTNDVDRPHALNIEH